MCRRVPHDRLMKFAVPILGLVYAHDIPAGGTKSFQLQIWRDRNFSYRFDSITAF